MPQSQFIAPCSREMVKKLSLFNALGWKRIARQQWRARIETSSTTIDVNAAPPKRHYSGCIYSRNGLAYPVISRYPRPTTVP